MLIQTLISSWTKCQSSHEPNADPPLRSKHRFRPTPVTPSSPYRRSFTVVRSPSFRKTHDEFFFHLWPIRPPIHTSPHCRCTVTEPYLHKTHKSDPHAHRIRCAFYIYIHTYIYIYIYIYLFIYINIYIFIYIIIYFFYLIFLIIHFLFKLCSWMFKGINV